MDRQQLYTDGKYVHQAIQYTGNNLSAIVSFFGPHAGEYEEDFLGDYCAVTLPERECKLKANKGDWFIWRNDGSFHVYTDAEFRKEFKLMERGVPRKHGPPGRNVPL